MGLNENLVGSPADQFFINHGPPISSYKLNENKVIYIWTERGKSVQLPGNSTATISTYGNTSYVNQTYSPGSQINVQCQIRLVVANGVIENVMAHSDSIGLWEMSRCNEIFGKTYPRSKKNKS